MALDVRGALSTVRHPIRSLSRVSWWLYSAAAMMKGMRDGANDDGGFARQGSRQGTVPATLCKPLLNAIEGAKVLQLEHDDCASSYESSPRVRQFRDQLNAGLVYLDVAEEQRAALVAVLEHLDEPIRASLGAPWQIVNVRCWKTLPSALHVGANEWHVDGFPSAFMKVLLYLSPVGRESGTTEVILSDGSMHVVEGPVGSWLLFRNGQLRHRGVAPSGPSVARTVLELTIARAFKSRLAPVCAGLNAKYPRFPWSRRAARGVAR